MSAKTKLTQAMVLAAGLSTRMRPLTNTLPKILLPILGKSHLQRTLDYLSAQGLESLAMNAFHGKSFLKKAVQDVQSSTSISVRVFEEEPIRGTGGGFLGMKPFVTSDHVAILNCDFLTDVDLQKMFAFHVAQKAMATLYLVRIPPKAKYGKVSTNDDHVVDSFSAKQSNYFFGGIHIISKEIFEHFPTDHSFCIIRNVYEPLLKKGVRIVGYKDDRARWLDVGELHYFHRNLFEVLKKPMPWMTDVTPDTSFFHPTAEIMEAVTSKHLIVEANARIEPGNFLKDTIVFPGTVVKAGEYERMILTKTDQIKV